MPFGNSPTSPIYTTDRWIWILPRAEPAVAGRFEAVSWDRRSERRETYPDQDTIPDRTSWPALGRRPSLPDALLFRLISWKVQEPHDETSLRKKFSFANQWCMYWNNLLESAGDIRADSLIKLSSNGRPWAVSMNVWYSELSSSSRNGSRASGWRHKAYTA